MFDGLRTDMLNITFRKEKLKYNRKIELKFEAFNLKGNSFVLTTLYTVIDPLIRINMAPNLSKF
jgi:hypothetical protein